MLKEKNFKIIKICFKFKSFHSHNFKVVLPKILQQTKSMSLNVKGFVSLPTKIQRMTVLRSPHVDKKSREQFEVKIYSKIFIVDFDLNDSFDKQRAKLLINFIKNSCSGLSLKISYTV